MGKDMNMDVSPVCTPESLLKRVLEKLGLGKWIKEF